MPCSGVGICAASRVFRVEEHPTSSEAINAPATVFVHALIEIRFGVWVLKASELSARWRNYTEFNENGYPVCVRMVQYNLAVDNLVRQQNTPRQRDNVMQPRMFFQCIEILPIKRFQKAVDDRLVFLHRHCCISVSRNGVLRRRRFAAARASLTEVQPGPAAPIRHLRVSDRATTRLRQRVRPRNRTFPPWQSSAGGGNRIAQTGD